MSGPLEIALDMIESNYDLGSNSIIGVYEAPITSKSSDQVISSLASVIANQIKA